jgi:anti-anti-sigma factor
VFDCRVIERAQDYVVVGLEGDYAGERLTDRVRETLEDHYVDDGVRRIRVDVHALRYIDLEGVASLLALRRDSTERGKRFTIEGAQGQVREKLAVTGVLDYLEGATKT